MGYIATDDVLVGVEGTIAPGEEIPAEFTNSLGDTERVDFDRLVEIGAAVDERDYVPPATPEGDDVNLNASDDENGPADPPEPPAPPARKPRKPAAPSAPDLGKLKKAELVKLAKKAGVDSTGTVKDLRARLAA